MSEFWKSVEAADGWSGQVADHGDTFQQIYLKSFALSAFVARANKGNVATLFPSLVLCAMRAVSGEGARNQAKSAAWTSLRKASDWRALVGGALTAIDVEEGKDVDLSNCLVVDIGCGEGFLTRFLCSFGATCIGFDHSAPLLRHANEKGSACDVGRFGSIRYEVAELEADDFDLLQRIGMGRQSIEKYGHVLVLCTNVLDHLREPRAILKSIRSLCDLADGKALVVASTLSPTFFTECGPLRRVPPAEIANQPGSGFTFPWARTPTPFYPRGWATYEGLFTSEQFRVEYFHETDLEVVSNYVGTSDLNPDWPQVGGPFSLWSLAPYPKGSEPSDDLIKSLFAPKGVFADTSESWQKFLLGRKRALSIRGFDPHELVALPGATCRGLKIVTEGTFAVTVNGAETQEIKSPGFFGDLESTSGFYSGRYLYQVRAGATGGACLEIPTDVVTEILTGTKDGTIGDRLFVAMRDRFNAFTPFYHRSMQLRPKGHLGKKVTDGASSDGIDVYLKKHKVVALNLEHVVRCLVTNITLQERKLRQADPKNEIPEAALCINPRDMEAWIGAATTSTKGGNRSRPYANELSLLQKIGVIEAIPISLLTAPNLEKGRPNPDYAQTHSELADQVYFSLVKSASDLIIPKLVREKDRAPFAPGALAAVVAQTRDFAGTNSWGKGGAIRNQNANQFELSEKGRRIVNASIQSLTAIIGNKDAEDANKIIARYFFNISYLRWALFGRDERRFIVIRDYPFLRRVTAGGMEWLTEAVARARLYDDEDEDEHRKMQIEEIKLPRFEHYLKYVRAFVLGYWKQGWDLENGGPRLEGREVSWRLLTNTGFESQ